MPKSDGAKGRAVSAGCDDLPDLVELASTVDPQLAIIIKHPRRVQLIAVAHQREISKSEFAKEAGITLKESIGHFDALIAADFLEFTRSIGTGSAVKHMYRATKRAYFSVLDWGKLGKTIQKGMGEAVLADLNGRVTDALQAGTFQARDDVVLYWLGLTLDEESWPEFVKVLSWAIKEVQDLGVETVRRQANGEGNGRSFPVTFGIAGFESPEGKGGQADECSYTSGHAAGEGRHAVGDKREDGRNRGAK